MRVLAVLLVSLCAGAQMIPIAGPGRYFGGSPITLDSTCSGSANSVTAIPCSSAMTVTAGDTITCEAFATAYRSGIWISDPANGVYDNVYGMIHPSGAGTFNTVAVFSNSAGGSITPQVNNATGNAIIRCQAWAGTRTSKVIDGGPVGQAQATTGANPTSGTAAAPTNANSVVIGSLTYKDIDPSTASGSGWTPSGTLTPLKAPFDQLVQYFEYQIQTSASAVNAPFTVASNTYADIQEALLNASSPAGYRTLTGFYGAPAIAKSNGTTVTTGDLNGATTTLTTMNAGDNGWTISGTAPTYDTSVAPSGTGTILLQHAAHQFGDAGTSIRFTGAMTANSITWQPTVGVNPGTASWLSFFHRVGSSGISAGPMYCDTATSGYGTTVNNLTLQTHYSAANGVYFRFESAGTGASSLLIPSNALALDTDYWVQVKTAGVNDQNHQLLIYRKSGSVWGLTDTFNYSVLCAASSNLNCDTNPPTAAAGTGTSAGGLATISVTLSSGSISVGQVIQAAGVPYLTVVASVSGSGPYSVTPSQPISALSGAAINFYAKPTTLVAATNGTASAGSTTLTVTAPGVGTIAADQPVGGPGIAAGTTVVSVSGTTVTLSQPTSSAISSGGVTFWSSNSNLFVTIGKITSCNLDAPIWFSALTYDPFGTWGAFSPN